MPIDESMSTALIERTVWAVRPYASPATVLVVRDNGDHGGDDDTLALQEYMADVGHEVDLLNEPAGGLSADDLAGYQVVVFSSLESAIDDVASVEALLEFSGAGFGVVLHGQDIAQDVTSAPLESLTRLRFVDDGRSDDDEDDDEDGHEVVMAPSSTFTADLPEMRFGYFGDIDTTEVAGAGAEVVAVAVENEGQNAKPAMVIWAGGHQGIPPRRAGAEQVGSTAPEPRCAPP